MRRLVIGPDAWLLAAVWLVAATGTHAADQRAALAELRQNVERRHAAEQAACAQQFAVTSCSEQARLRRRDDLVALQKAQAALDARERRAAIANRQVAAVRPPAAASAASAAKVRALRPLLPQAQTGRADPAAIESLPATRAGAPNRSAQERRARQAHEQRQREAELHRKKVETRNAARAASAGQRSAPLPPAPAASAR